MANGLMTDIPKEITDYKEKIILGFTIRQIICLVVAILVGFAVFAVSTFGFGLSFDKSTDIVVPFTLPFLAVGFVKRNGYPFEKYLMIMIKYHLGTKKRTYKSAALLKQNEVKVKNDRKDFNQERQGSYSEAQGLKVTKKTSRQNCKRAKAEAKKSRYELRKEAKGTKQTGKYAKDSKDLSEHSTI